MCKKGEKMRTTNHQPIRGLTLKLIFLLPLALVFATMASAQTAPTTIFEIDGDSVTGSTYGVSSSINCDWNTLNGSNAANTTTPAGTCAAGGAAFGAYGFLEGAPGEPNFSTGGSKDSNDVSKWLFTITSTPDKDTLSQGFAASYTGPASSGSDNLLQFGADRFASNGDSNIGIWFFQQNISIPTGVSKGSFSGLHTPGDILIVSAFSGGGGTSTVSVYQWEPATCPNSNYPNLTTSGKVDVCVATNIFALFADLTVGAAPTCTSSTPACAVVNNQQITVGWPYNTKFGGTSNSAPTGAFYEGGIDLTSLIPAGQTAPCFASFLFETRSSQSINSVLKDFLVGSFPECHVSISKAVTCNSFNSTGTFNYS